MKEIILSVYDSAWYWEIVRIEDGKIYKTTSNDTKLDDIEKTIYDSELLMWYKDRLTKDKVIKQLMKEGYRVIICNNGSINIWDKERIV